MKVVFIAWIVFNHLEKPKVQLEKTLFENQDFCGVVMHSEDAKMLEFNQHQKSDKTPSIFFADIESLIKRINGYE